MLVTASAEVESEQPSAEPSVLLDDIIDQPANQELAVIAASITALHDSATKLATDALNKMRQCGRFSIQAKKLVGHGNFSAWIQANCPSVSDRTVRRYMKLARGWTHLSKSDTVADL